MSREERGAGETPTLVGHFAVFNDWTEINGMEGNFMERVAPRAFAAAFSNDRASMKALFQHGHDPQVGDKPLGPIAVLREDHLGGVLRGRPPRHQLQP